MARDAAAGVVGIRALPSLACPSHGGELGEEDGELVCLEGCRFPVVGKIPRFVGENYAESFGHQWNAFRTTQLDSRTGLSISRDRLRRCLGGTFDPIRSRTVLEIGCGAGRFTEVLLDEGALVLAIDLSSAVEASRANIGDRPGYTVAQADVRRLPVRDGAFDFVVCLGMIQHTPDPEETIRALAASLAPGGELVIDHYGLDYPETRPRRIARAALLRLAPRRRLSVAVALSRALLVVHRLAWHDARGFRRARQALAKVSPLVDYYDAYPQLGKALLAEWAILDTHDTLTDVYKHRRSEEQIARALEAAGLDVIEVRTAGNGVEARARKAA